MENRTAPESLININLRITATPAITFEKKSAALQPVTVLSAAHNNGFSIEMEAAFDYESLSEVMSAYLLQKRFELSEGIFHKYIVVEQCRVHSHPNEKLVVEVHFSGSYKGKVFFTGKPVYNAATQKIELQELDYDLQTKSFLLNTAKWLFDRRILSEIKKYTAIDLSGFYQAAAVKLDVLLNKDWTRGIKGSGKVTDIEITSVSVQAEHLLVRSTCTGTLSVMVSEINLKL